MIFKMLISVLVTIVIVSRLVYRKGIDLLAQVMADICVKYQMVHFLIGGDGPKRELLEEVRTNLNLEERITLLGSLEHSQVRHVLTQGHIFLNTSLTEAYCMAIVEAASCGLQVVSTSVGGIPEVLPPELIYLTEPTVPSLMEGLEKALDDLRLGKVVDPFLCHKRVSSLYSWQNVTLRTEQVYAAVTKESSKSIGQQLRSYMRSNVLPFLLVISLMYLYLKLLEWMVPRQGIDLARRYRRKSQNCKPKTS